MSPLDLGNVPEWLTIVGAAGGTAIHHLPSRRRARVEELGRKVAELVDLDAEHLAGRVLSSPELEELVNRVIEEAARTTWQEKLNGLAAVVAAAIGGDDTVVSTQLMVESVLARIGRPHVQALVVVEQNQPVQAKALAGAWPGGEQLLESIVPWLVGEGLIRNVSVGTYDGMPGNQSWLLTTLGEKVLSLLEPDSGQGPT